MKKLFTLLVPFTFGLSLFGQISYNGCTNLITGPSPYTLTQSGTTNDGGTLRNSYTSPPVGCSAGSCSYTIAWSIGQQRWELYLNGSNLLHHNSSASAPNPPSLTLGTWTNGSGCSNISSLSGDVQSSIILPVGLLSFSAKKNSRTVELLWETTEEFNNEKFEIELSENGREFNKVGEVEGAGTTAGKTGYVFSIENPQIGTSYYRLKQVDFDGNFEYSKTINIQFEGSDQQVGAFFPNPTNSGLTNLQYTSQSTGNIDVSVFDIAGKLVLRQAHSVSNGRNNLMFNFSEVEKGIYFVRLGNDKNSVYRKLIIE